MKTNKWLGMLKEAQEISYRPLGFYDKNKSALLSSAILALIGGTGGALSSKKKKSRIWRGVIGAILGGAAGAELGHLYDRHAFMSRLKNGGIYVGRTARNQAIKNVDRLQDFQFSYMTHPANDDYTAAKSLRELDGKRFGHRGRMVSGPARPAYVARINNGDSSEYPLGDESFSDKSTLLDHYRYGIIPSDAKGTSVAVALPEYDADKAPGILSIRSVKFDPEHANDRYFSLPDNAAPVMVNTPEGKAVLRDLVMRSKPLTKAILEKLNK